MRHNPLHIFIALCALFPALTLTGQINDAAPETPPKPDSTVIVRSDPRSQTFGNLRLSTHSENYETWDSSFVFVHRFNKLYRNFLPFTDLGYIGSPQKLLIHNPFVTPGWTPGFNPYPVQNRRPEDFVFYSAKVPLTRAWYAQGASNATMLDIMHTQNFSPTWNFTSNFSTVSNKDYYNPQSLTHHLHRSISLGNRYRSRNGRIESFVILNWNRARRNENFGHVEDSARSFYRGFVSSTFLGRRWDNSRQQGFYFPNKNFANSLYKTRHHIIESKLKLDSNFYLFHTLDWIKDLYQFADAEEPDSFYINQNMFFDSTGTNDSTVWTQLKNSFGLEKKFRILDEPGVFRVSYIMNRGVYNTRYKTAPNIYYTQGMQAFLSYTLFDFLQLRSRFEYYFTGVNLGDDFLETQLTATLNKRLSLFLNNTSQTNTATQYQRQFSGNLYQYKKPFAAVHSDEYRIGGAVNYSHVKGNIQFTIGNTKNYIYVDTTGNFQQLDPALRYFRLTAKINLRLGKFHLDQEITWQKNDHNNILNLPEFSDLISLYFQGRILKKSMLARIGLDVMYISEYTANKYLPYRGLFTYVPGTKAGNYPVADVFFSGEVKTMMFFIKYQHFNSYWINYGFNNTFNSSAGNPILPANLRIGLIWRFYN